MRYRHAHVELDPPSLGPWLDGWKDAGPHAGALALLPESQARHVPFLQAAFRERGLALVGAIFPALVTDEGFSTTGAWLLGFDAMPPAFLLEGLGRDGRADAAKLAEAARTHCLRSPGEPAPTLFLVFVVVKHGYPVAKALMRATSTTGNRIRLIDGRRAMDVYREVIRADFGVDLTHGNFYDYAVHFPFGVISAADVVVRIPVAFEDDGSIACVGEVPPESMLRLLRAPSLDESPCVDAIAGALPAAPGRGPLLAFYCAGRRMHLGGDAATELSRLRQATGASALVGALSLGEIGIFEGTGIPQFHNAALVCA